MHFKRFGDFFLIAVVARGSYHHLIVRIKEDKYWGLGLNPSKHGIALLLPEQNNQNTQKLC